MYWKGLEKLPADGFFVYLFQAFDDGPLVRVKRWDWSCSETVIRLDGTPVYAGSSIKLRNRIRRHLSSSEWVEGLMWLRFWEIPHYSSDTPAKTRTMMLESERWLITKLSPSRNRAVPARQKTLDHFIINSGLGDTLSGTAVILTGIPAEA